MRVPLEEIRSVARKAYSKHFVDVYGKMHNLHTTGISKKFLNIRYQLFFVYMNKVTLPRLEKRTVASVTIYL